MTRFSNMTRTALITLANARLTSGDPVVRYRGCGARRELMMRDDRADHMSRELQAMRARAGRHLANQRRALRRMFLANQPAPADTGVNFFALMAGA